MLGIFLLIIIFLSSPYLITKYLNAKKGSKHRKIIGSILLILFVFVFFIIPINKEIDFYEYHVWECEQAHKNGYSFAVCSGFWYDPEPWHIDDWGIVHPSENPRDNIMHGSNLGQTVEVYGLFGFITTDTMVYGD